MLSQGELCDAAVNFDGYQILQWHRAVSLSQHGFLYRPTSAKLHKVRWFSRRWRKITAIAENHSTQLVKAMMIDIIDDTDNIDPSLLRDLCPWLTVSQLHKSQPQGHKFTQHVIHLQLTQFGRRYTVICIVFDAPSLSNPSKYPHIPYVSRN